MRPLVSSQPARASGDFWTFSYRAALGASAEAVVNAGRPDFFLPHTPAAVRVKYQQQRHRILSRSLRIGEANDHNSWRY